MAIGVMNFPILTPDQANPFGHGLAQGVQARLQAAQAAKQEAENPYVGESAMLKNIYQQLVNQYTPKDYETTFNLRGAQGGLANAQAKMAQYKLDHPGYMGGAEAQTIQALMDLGIIDPNSLHQQGAVGGGAPSAAGVPAAAAPDMGGISQGAPAQSAPALNQNIMSLLTQQMPNNMTPIPGADQNQPKMTPWLQAAQMQMPAQPAPQLQAPQSPQNPAAAPDPTHPFQTGNSLVDAILNKPFSRIAYQNQMTQGYNWAHLPVETRNQLISQGYGMGIDPMKMVKYINQGMGLQQIAQAEGLDPENLPPPIYPPTTATKTRVQQVEQVSHELDYLSSATTPLIKQYANTFAGFSGDRIRDMLSNNPDAQRRFGQYIGALSLQTGLANGRVLAEGGKAGYEVMKAVKDSALKGIDQNSPIKMSKVAYEEAQKTIDRILQKGVKIRTTTGMNPFSEIGNSHRQETETAESAPETPAGSGVSWKRVGGKLVRAG